jgi:hypothetical protein
MHNPGFWEELMNTVIHSLIPGRKYGILLQPRSLANRVTLGPAVHINSQTTMKWLKKELYPYSSTNGRGL